MIGAASKHLVQSGPQKPLSGLLRAFARVMAVGGFMILPSLAHAQNCIPNHQAAYPMQLMQQDAQDFVGPAYKLAWYSTSSAQQAFAAFDEMIQYAYLMRDVPEITQIHILQVNENGAYVLFGNHQITCGFSGPFVMDARNAQFALNAAHAQFEYEQAKVQQNQPQGQRSTQAGDPVFNMSDEDRRAWQMMQGIIQGNDPAGGLQDLFTGNGQ